MEGLRGCRRKLTALKVLQVLLGLVLLRLGGCLGAAAAPRRQSNSSQGPLASLNALSRRLRDPTLSRTRLTHVGCDHSNTQSLQHQSKHTRRQQQCDHVQERSAGSATASTSQASTPKPSSSNDLQPPGSRRRLTQSLWDVVGGLLQKAQEQVQHSSRQLATESSNLEQQLWNLSGDMTEDPAAGGLVLQSIEPLLAWPSISAAQQPVRQPASSPGSSSTANRHSIRGVTYKGTGPAKLELRVTFAAMGSTDTSLRLPLPPRTFAMEIEDLANQNRGVCKQDLVYKDQTVTCQDLDSGKDYVVTLVDTQNDALVLASKNVRITSDAVNTDSLQVLLGMVQVETSFGSLAWAGGMYYPKPRGEDTAVVIHAQIVGAQVVLYTKSQPNSIWDMQWTGDDGSASFFLVPNSQEFIANMSVGDTQLSSSPISFSSDPSQPSSIQLAQQPQQLMLTAAPHLLCTGEVEDVRGESGQFPANLTLQQNRSKPAIYHPTGFFCRWELLPDNPELTLTVDYSNLLPDESVTLYLAPSNVIQLRRPKQRDIGGVFQTSVWVERSIFVEFQTTRDSTSKVGAFSVSWTSGSPRGRSLLGSRTMVVVLACVSAAGAVLAACCFYCMCCSRRRRGGVVVDSSVVQHVNLLRVPSSVRELLPSKPYQPPPPDNPLPGAAVEPDCCSICLVELEAGEHVTVLPCMHFYHKECINSWLDRNCTCPLCKANVLHAFANTAGGSNNITQQVRRSMRRHRHRRAGAPAAGDGDAAGRGSSGSQQHAAVDAAAAAGLNAAAEVEMAHSPAAAGSELEQQVGQLRAAYPTVHLGSVEGLAGSGSSSATAAPGDTVAVLHVLPQHPSLQQMPAGAAAASSLKRSGSSASNSDPAANGWSSGEPLSPAASMGTLQSGTVQASSADFAAAAAAAAAALAAVAAGTGADDPDSTVGSSAEAAAAARSGATSPPGAAAGDVGGTVSGAHVSVSALRSSSRVWGRRLQALLWTPSGGGPAAAADAGSVAGSLAGHHTVELPLAAMAGGSRVTRAVDSRSSSRASAHSPELVLTLAPVRAPGRAAVTIYAYAGNPQPLGSGAEVQAQTGPELEGILVGGPARHGMYSAEQDAAGDAEAGTLSCSDVSLPGAPS